MASSTPNQNSYNAYRSLRTKPACCACKHQRRRCSSDSCILAPYFPPEKSRDFQNVHKLYGIHNVVNLLKKISPNLREECVKSICFEANTRAKYPVDGCLAMIFELQRQIIQCTTELDAVYERLSLYKPRLCDDLINETDHWDRMFSRNSAGEGTSNTGHEFPKPLI
ncbi:hypothetical protein ACS0TY_012385 [Phlomoides rotata]